MFLQRKLGRTRVSALSLWLSCGLLTVVVPNFLASVAWAQNTSSGTIAGQVTDAQGAAIAGAEVRLVDKATGKARTFVTNETGRYSIFNLDPGTYDVAITKSGFSETRVAAQSVQVGLVLTLNIIMQVGTTSTTVDVEANAGAELQTTNATVGSTISGAQLENLPNLGRDANALFTLQPGVAPGGNVAG